MTDYDDKDDGVWLDGGFYRYHEVANTETIGPAQHLTMDWTPEKMSLLKGPVVDYCWSSLPFVKPLCLVGEWLFHHGSS